MTDIHDSHETAHPADDDNVEYREIEVDADDSQGIVSALMDVIEEEGLALDRSQLIEKGFAWLRNADGSKSSLILLDGFSVATVPVGSGTTAPHSQPVLLARTEGKVDEDDAPSHIDTVAQERGSCLVMRSQDAKLALAIGTKDDATLCLPVDFLVYEGVVVAVAAGEVFATRTDFEAQANKAMSDLQEAAAQD